jgi:mono/diheme cytochrome c family protein
MRLQLCLTLVFASTVTIAQTPHERGAYLVNAVMACDACHTPRGPNGLDMSRRFSGGAQVWDTPAFRVRGSNITPDKETGLGDWSAEDLKRALSEGVRPNGVPLAPQMPYEFYKALTPSDLDAVVLYLRSLPAVRNEVDPPQYKAEASRQHVPTDTANPQSEDPVERGRYLATLAHCMECHSRGSDGTMDFKGRGGAKMGPATVSNITSHPTKGLGAWTDDEIKRALTHSVSRDGRRLAPPMQRDVFFSKLTQADLNALVAWVRSLPAAD